MIRDAEICRRARVAGAEPRIGETYRRALEGCRVGVGRLGLRSSGR